MKKAHITLALLSLLGFFSCKDYLKTTPTDFLAPSNYYETEQQLEFARASVYNILANGALYGSYSHYILAWNADEGYMNRATLTTGPWNYFYSPADSYNLAFWTLLFNGVNRANVVIANVDRNPAINQNLRDKIRGEALFLRGYYYSLLVQYYGGVPLKLTPTASVVNVDQAKSTVREIYDQIIADMEAAEPLVPEIAAIGFGGAISKSAVRGILARVNLTMAGYPLRDESRYAEARRWAKMIIDDTQSDHELNPSYQDIFRRLAADVYDIKESIWEVEFYGNMSDQYNMTNTQGWINGPSSLATSATGRADSYMSITAKFYNVFEPGDARKWYAITHWTYNNNNINGSKTMTPLPTTELAKYALRPAKWRREYETKLPKAANRTPQNTPLLRYADVLLMYAEAENAINGPTAEAVNAINLVRQRGWSKGVKTITVTNGGSGYTEPPTVVFSGGQARATATIDGSGQVTAVTLDRDMEGITFYREGIYQSPPTISFQSSSGSGAAAEATIHTPGEANLTSTQTASKESLLSVIQDERMRELNFEISRKADLLRWGIFLDVHEEMANTIEQDAPGVFYIGWYRNATERDLLMPIPDAELTVNRNMEQNPGW